MKAIIKTNSFTYYSKYNYLTFDIEEIGNTFVSIKGLNPDYPDNLTDFSFAEIFIVDIEKEIEKQSIQDKEKLIKYCEFRNININKP